MAIEFPHEETTEKIIGVFYEVYNELGYGYIEPLYSRAMPIALSDAGIAFSIQEPTDVWFRGQKIGQFFLDLVAGGSTTGAPRKTEKPMPRLCPPIHSRFRWLHSHRDDSATLPFSDNHSLCVYLRPVSLSGIVAGPLHSLCGTSVSLLHSICVLPRNLRPRLSAALLSASSKVSAFICVICGSISRLIQLVESP